AAVMFGTPRTVNSTRVFEWPRRVVELRVPEWPRCRVTRLRQCTEGVPAELQQSEANLLCRGLRRPSTARRASPLVGRPSPSPSRSVARGACATAVSSSASPRRHRPERTRRSAPAPRRRPRRRRAAVGPRPSARGPHAWCLCGRQRLALRPASGRRLRPAQVDDSGRRTIVQAASGPASGRRLRSTTAGAEPSSKQRLALRPASGRRVDAHDESVAKTHHLIGVL
ncbi:hypothetical protein M885DRAFT_540260, partial [Pelagophyceae sp. CCMP2097]